MNDALSGSRYDVLATLPTDLHLMAEMLVWLISITAGVSASGSVPTKQIGTTGADGNSRGSTMWSAPASKKPAQLMIFQRSMVRAGELAGT
jgi:hypothetical protein